MQGRIPVRDGRRGSRGRFCLRSERGGALIEIMMAAMLVALAATAVFKGIDGASAVSSGSKSRAIAASLAQDDQERLRATTPSTLVDLDATKTVSRNNVNYTVRSVARWTADRDAVPNCSATTSRAGYLRISSTVTWPDMLGSKPIVATSLLAPPNGTVTSNRGAIGVKVLDQNAQPVPGVNVDVTGASLSGTTDVNGCVFWDDVVAGNYTYTAQKAGTVDYEGDPSITRPIGVSGGQTRTDTISLAPPAAMTVAVMTKGWTGTPVAGTVRPGDKLFLANTKMAALNGIRSWSLASNTATVNQLYPMQYGVFMGTCSWENNPSNDADVPAGTGVVAYPWTGTQTIFEPMLKIRVRYNNSSTGMNTSGTAPSGNGPFVRIAQRPGTGGCSNDFTPYATPATWIKTATISDGVTATDDAGRVPDGVGFPYGTYRICAEGKSGTTWRSATVDVDNDDPNGTDVDLNLTSTANQGNGAGRCPTVL
jgi:Tfp pilus assembly protein PilV